MTNESKAMVRVVHARPSQLATQEEAREVIRAFSGFSDRAGTAMPLPTAVAIHGLLQMGLQPFHINLFQGKPYVNVDGMIALAHDLCEQNGEKWGRISYEVASPNDRTLAGAKPEELCISAIYSERVTKRIALPDGSVVTEPGWLEVQRATGRANPKAPNQPVERQYPERMAQIRATRQLLRLKFGIRVPKGVGYAQDKEVIEEAEEPISDAQPVPPAKSTPPPVKQGPVDAEFREVTVTEGAAKGAVMQDKTPDPEGDELEFGEPPGQASEKAPEHPALTPRDIPAGAAAQTHPFIVDLQLAMSGAGMWTREAMDKLTYQDPAGKEWKSQKAVIQMARDGHALQTILDAVLKAQPPKA